MQPDAILAAVRPRGTIVFQVGAYVLGIVCYGLIATTFVIPFGLPPGHPIPQIAFVVGALAGTIAMHFTVRRMLDAGYLTLTASRLTLGKHRTATIRLEDVVDTVPILSVHKPLQKPAVAINSEQFTTVLLRLRDGSRLPLSSVRNTEGFEAFLVNLFGLVGPTIRTQGDLSAGDLAVLGARNANKLHKP